MWSDVANSKKNSTTCFALALLSHCSIRSMVLMPWRNLPWYHISLAHTHNASPRWGSLGAAISKCSLQHTSQFHVEARFCTIRSHFWDLITIHLKTEHSYNNKTFPTTLFCSLLPRISVQSQHSWVSSSPELLQHGTHRFSSRYSSMVGRHEVQLKGPGPLHSTHESWHFSHLSGSSLGLETEVEMWLLVQTVSI